MSQNSDSSHEGEIVQFLLDELMDDTDEKMMMMIMEMEMEMKKEEAESSHGRKHSRKYINQERETGHTRLFNDYFSNEPVYTDEMFRRRYRMSKELFLQIVEALSNHSKYFQMWVDANGLSPLQKCIVAIHQLAYGKADQYDEYARIDETTTIDCLMNFCRCVIEVFGPVYLRRPNADDVQRLFQLHSNVHGFPGMLGSIGCMHWPWKNCPLAWKGTRGDKVIPTIMLEAVASYDLWIWHAFFGIAGSNNDINVLNQSLLFNDVLKGYSPHVQFTVNASQYTKGYYLADDIYPEWASYVKSFPYPEDPKSKKVQRDARGRKKGC